MSRRTLVFVISLFASSAVHAAGLSINVPVVGRVTGGGGVIFATALDVTNNAGTPTSVDFYFDGTDSKTGEAVSIEGTISDSGIGPRGRDTVSAQSNVHFEDFISSLVAANLLAPTSLQDGMLGSALFIYNGYTKRGQGSVTARFYNAFGGGLVGVSIRGHEIAANEPLKLVATLRDTTAQSAVAATYPNLFVNHTGLAPDGTASKAPVTIQLSAVSSRTGRAVGTPATYTISKGQTLSVGHAFQVLGVDTTTEDTIIVTVAVTSGSAAIEGLVSQVDVVTKDGSAFEMSRADF